MAEIAGAVEKQGWTVSENRKTGGANVALLEDFLASGEKCIAKDMETERKAASKRNSLIETAKHDERYANIKVSKRGTVVYVQNNG